MKSIKEIKAEPAGQPKSADSVKAAYLYAVILVVIVLAQLFTFEKFTTLMISFNFLGGEMSGRLATSLIVIFEVFALPFLLRLRLSKLMRVTSMVFSWLVPLFWLKSSLWVLLTNDSIVNIGLLGTAVKLPPGWWAVCVSIALGFLSAWVSWGFWPLSSKRSK